MIDVVWLVPALPLAGFVILFFLGRRLGEPLAGWLATATCSLAFIVTAGIYLDLLSKGAEERSVVKTLFTWIPAGSLHVDVAFLVDPLSITMALFVTGISAMIHLYSIGYMHGDENFSKFFVYLNLFVFSMLMLVLGSNLLVTFLGWEGVGTCSYLLISFWFTRATAATAGKKAFVTNRIGDWGFMLAMFLTFQAVGSLDYGRLLGSAPTMASTTVTAIALLLFVGAVGKSAQLPLYLWLPDAMEGPTPVSALIHAATMVTAGVYLMCRISPLLSQSDTALWIIAIVGCATAFFAATIAVAQNDIKKVLAYSTVSQLGYMFLAVGSGAYVAAVFHMITHAFFKALLFLGSGSVIHGMHDQQDMRRMGRLAKLLPITAITFIIGWLAIAGVPPFAGFWSKDDILLAAWNKSVVLWFVGLVTALLTGYYMTRQVVMVFFGEARWNESRPEEATAAHGTAVPAGAATDTVNEEVAARVEHEGHGFRDGEQPHESGWLMLIPLIVLGGLALLGGLLDLPFSDKLEFLGHWLDPVVGAAEQELDVETGLKWLLAGLAMVASFGGLFLGYVVYQRRRLEAVEPELLAHAWYYDEAVSAFVGGPGEEAFEGVALFDHEVVDGAVNGTGGGFRLIGRGLRRVQTGFVRNYALGIGFGAVLLLVWFVTRGMG